MSGRRKVESIRQSHSLQTARHSADSILTGRISFCTSFGNCDYLVQLPTPPFPATIHTGGPQSLSLPPSLPPIRSHIFLFLRRRGMGMPRIPAESGVTESHPFTPPPHSHSQRLQRETLHSERQPRPIALSARIPGQQRLLNQLDR